MSSRKKRPSSLPSIHQLKVVPSRVGLNVSSKSIEKEPQDAMLPYLVKIQNALFDNTPLVSSSKITSHDSTVCSSKRISGVQDSPEISHSLEKRNKKQRPGSGPRHQHSESFKNMINGHISQSEKRHAAIVIQRIMRGFIAKVIIWRLPDGLGSIRMIIRIQCWVRQYIARGLVSKRLLARDTVSACLIQALFRGFKYGRLAAKRRRVEIMSEAASRIQRIYRGRLTKKWFAAFKAMIRENKTRFLQRCYRGSRARRAVRKLRFNLEAGIVHLGKVRFAYLSGALHARVEALLGGGVCGRHPVILTKQVEVAGLESFVEKVDDTQVRWRHLAEHNDDRDEEIGSFNYMSGNQRYFSDHGWMEPGPTPDPSQPSSRHDNRRNGSSRGNGRGQSRDSLHSGGGQQRLGTAGHSRPQTTSEKAKSSYFYGLVLSEMAEEELLGLALGVACICHDYGLSRKIIEALIRCAWTKIKHDTEGGGSGCRVAYDSAARAANATLASTPFVSVESCARMRNEATDKYRQAALGPPIHLLYAYSIILQLEWTSSGQYRVFDHRALDESLLICEKCWWAEGDMKRLRKERASDYGGSVFEKYEVFYFRAAAEISYRKKNGPTSMLDAKVSYLCISVYKNFVYGLCVYLLLFIYDECSDNLLFTSFSG